MHKQIFLILFLLFLNIVSCYAKPTTPASCTYSVTNGWTQTITWKCASTVNLNGAIIQFTVDNPAGIVNPENVWGFTNIPAYPLNPKLSFSGTTVTLALNFSVNPVNLAANTTSNFTYSTNNNVKISSFALYPAGSAGDAASLTLTLPIAQPAELSTTGVTAILTDAANIKQQINVAWNSQATLSGLSAGAKYTLSANPLPGQYNQYLVSFSPNSFTAQSGQNNASINLIRAPLPTGNANVTVSGLPTGLTTSVMFNYSNASGNQVITFTNVNNGTRGYILPAGYQYTVTTRSVSATGKRYTTTPIYATIIANTTSAIRLPFTASISQTVTGWPNYLAMGAITDDAVNTGVSLQTRPVDAIFKYGGMGGNGDRGEIIYPIFDLQTAVQANGLTSYYQQHGINNTVRPVMVIYTAFMSNGIDFGDFDYGNMVLHFITLMMEAQKLQSYKTAQMPNPGSIILNPDLLGLIQQQNLLPQLNSMISNLSLQTAIRTAVCFITTTLSTTYGTNLNYEQLYQAILAQSGGAIWAAMTIWDTYKAQYLSHCTANPTIPASITIPAFSNDFAGWVQAHNWMIRQFAPDVTFGWQENLWSTGTANWVHQNYTASELKSKISTPLINALTSMTAYSGSYAPDFLVFDKYEMDAIPAASGSGYLYNARDWNNVLAHVKNVSEAFSVPIMLWQIPGGHLQQNNDVDTRTTHASNEPDFFFGDTSNPLNNLKAWISGIPLPTAIYGTNNMVTYLSMNLAGTANNYTWTTSNLQQTVDSHVFAILWGGGNTTSVSSFPSDDGGWLANKLIAYYKNPVVLPTTHFIHQ